VAGYGEADSNMPSAYRFPLPGGKNFLLRALKELSEGSKRPFPIFLYWWMRIVIPLALLFVGLNRVLESIFNIKLFHSFFSS